MCPTTCKTLNTAVWLFKAAGGMPEGHQEDARDAAVGARGVKWEPRELEMGAKRIQPTG